LRNTAIINGELGTLEVSLRDNNIQLNSEYGHFDLDENVPQSFVDMFADQLRSFVAAARGEQTVEVEPADAMRVLEVIERCYQNRRALELPWMSPSVKEPI
jgi:predicted dehydrogenase